MTRSFPALPVLYVTDMALKRKADEIDLFEELMATMETAPLPDQSKWFRLSLGTALYRGKNEQLVKRLMEAAPDVVPGLRTRYGFSALCAAAQGGNLAVISMVMEAGVDLDEKSGERSMPALMFSILSRHEDAALLLLSKGADVNVRDGHRYSVLHYACSDGSPRLVGALLGAGAKLAVKDEFGCTPLLSAVSHKRPDIVAMLVSKDLLDRGNDREAMMNLTNDGGYSPLTMAVYLHHVPIVTTLLDAGASVDVAHVDRGFGHDEEYPLLYLARDHLELTQLLVSRGATVHNGAGYYNGFSALHWAAKSGTPDVLKHLVGRGRRLEKTFGRLEKDGLNFVGGTALHVATLFGKGRRCCVDVLIEKGADVNAQDWRDYTPLAALCRAMMEEDVEWCVEIASALLRAGADETIGGPNEKTPVELIGDGVDPAGALRGLLERASIWRRRKLWILCRARGRGVTFLKESTVTEWLVSVGEQGVFRRVMSFL